MRKYVEELSFGLISLFRPLHHRPMYAQPAARSGHRTNYGESKNKPQVACRRRSNASKAVGTRAPIRRMLSSPAEGDPSPDYETVFDKA